MTGDKNKTAQIAVLLFWDQFESEIMNDMGHDFKAPKQNDKMQWTKVALLYKSGFAYHSCGCNGPGYRPVKLSEVEEFVSKNKTLKSTGEALLQKLSVKN